mmetsp:Transcript_14045/g.41799  ORF Transcript_14045/g.41799 Transcript_14045/m.41799 type:complete len:279 (+) Transcript_14045:428-1264(+)
MASSAGSTSGRSSNLLPHWRELYTSSISPASTPNLSASLFWSSFPSMLSSSSAQSPRLVCLASMSMTDSSFFTKWLCIRYVTQLVDFLTSAISSESFAARAAEISSRHSATLKPSSAGTACTTPAAKAPMWVSFSSMPTTASALSPLTWAANSASCAASTSPSAPLAAARRAMRTTLSPSTCRRHSTFLELVKKMMRPVFRIAISVSGNSMPRSQKCMASTLCSMASSAVLPVTSSRASRGQVHAATNRAIRLWRCSRSIFTLSMAEDLNSCRGGEGK